MTVSARDAKAPKPGILVVEDEGVVALDLQRTLADFGYDPYAVAASAEEALACSEARTPDLVLMDVRIRGDADGVTTAGVLRERYDVPVIFLTAYADDMTTERASRIHPDAYLVKPVHPAELRSVVRRSLDRQGRERGLAAAERWFATAARCAADGVVTLDPEGRVVSMNLAAERLVERGAGAFLGSTLVETMPFLDQANRDLTETAVWGALKGWRSSVVEVHLRGPNCEPLRTVFSIAPMAHEDMIRGAVVIIRGEVGAPSPDDPPAR